MAQPSSRRKPVPKMDPIAIPTAGPSSPPRYILEVAPPYDIESGLPITRSQEDLPVYNEQNTTEPKTLARACWLWGFACPLVWIIGMCILWIPLRPLEPEQDVQKAQKMEEMIIILRKAELKYARRCAWSLSVFVVMIGIVVTAVVLSSR